jgi:multidrug efflux pump subunit AcrA (membrane-fusion protein)
VGTRGPCGRWVALGAVALLSTACSPAASSGAGPRVPPPATAAVTRQDITATTPVTATLGYAGSYLVRGQGGGTLTWLPSAGQIIRQGQSLYRTGDETPVILLYGSTVAGFRWSGSTGYATARASP